MLIPLIVTLVVAAALIQAAVFSTTIYLHRTATHRALVLHPAVAVLFRSVLWVTTGIATREWVAVHRKHHQFTDEEGDPHSPLLAGFWSVQIGNVFHYIREARKPEVLDKYARDIEDDWWERRLFRHNLIGPAAGVAALCALMAAAFGPVGVALGLLAAALHGVVYVFILSSSINGLCHYRGYRNFGNTATNIRLLALITGGEGLHNNHHGYPRSPKFSFRPSEFDPAWPVIWLLAKLKLAKPYRTIDEAQQASS